jgi:hypothetical protein
VSLASIIRAQLADGRPLRVTRALLEALEEAPARQSLNDLLPEALRDRVLELERERDDYAGRWEGAKAHGLGVGRERDEARAEVERLRDALQCMRVNHDAACERAGWRELGAIAVLLGYARGAAEDFGEVDVVGVHEAVSRLRSTSWPAERRDIAIREAEERGARWAIEAAEALVRASAGRRMDRALQLAVASPGRARTEHGAEVAYTEAHSVSEMDAKRICAEARKAGENE